MEIWIATDNKGKLNEFKQFFAKYPVTVRSQSELAAFTAKPENGDSFLANARIKAKTLHGVRHQDWVIADDSGLEVEGLGNLPGIHSARYAGPHASDSENLAKLLKMMHIRPMANRNAQFRCVLVLISPKGEEFIFEGVLKGTIAAKASGNLGFGYDPVFIPEGEKQTLAELGAGPKNKISHRGRAMQALLEKFGEEFSK